MDDATAAQRGAKRELRHRVLAARELLTGQQRTDAAAAIAAALLALPAIAAADVVAAYWSVGDEVPTQPFLDALQAGGRTVLLPLLQPDYGLGWERYAGAAALVPGPHGLLEPARTDRGARLCDAAVVVVPGVCFDRRGNRLGRGGGSYDRALAELAPRTPIIGIAWDCDIVQQVPAQHHDQPVHLIVTPTRVMTIDHGGH